MKLGKSTVSLLESSRPHPTNKAAYALEKASHQDVGSPEYHKWMTIHHIAGAKLASEDRNQENATLHIAHSNAHAKALQEHRHRTAEDLEFFDRKTKHWDGV